MWPYWLFFLFTAGAALLETRFLGASTITARKVRLDGTWWLIVAVLTLIVGYRYEVGADWFNYVRIFEQIDWAYGGLEDALAKGDPGYQLLQWLVYQLRGSAVEVNLLGAALFSFGLVVFCRSLPRPWLGLAVAMPYLVTVVGMGYTRQSIALGAVMVGLVSLGRAHTWHFVFWVLLGASFHKTAVLLLPIAALAATRKRVWTAFWIAVLLGLGYQVLLAGDAYDLLTTYVNAEMQSSGAFIRLAMNVVPATLLLLWHRKFEFSIGHAKLWKIFALISVGCFGLYFVTSATTALDRMALYLLPLQLVVFSYLPEVLGRRYQLNHTGSVAVISYYGAVLFFWLNFADHAFAWLPYRFYLFKDL